MVVREADWKDTVLTRHPGETIVRLREDGSRRIYRPGRPPIEQPPYTPRYTDRASEVGRG